MRSMVKVAQKVATLDFIPKGWMTRIAGIFILFLAIGQIGALGMRAISEGAFPPLDDLDLIVSVVLLGGSMAVLGKERKDAEIKEALTKLKNIAPVLLLVLLLPACSASIGPGSGWVTWDVCGFEGGVAAEVGVMGSRARLGCTQTVLDEDEDEDKDKDE